MLALALTHHLVLAQGLAIDMVLQGIWSLCGSVALVEYMPLGLGISNLVGGDPIIPDWYSLSDFRRAFSKYFVPIEEVRLGLNRILFVGTPR